MSSPASLDAEIAYPSAFGRYLLLHKLARGGMGNVFLAKTTGAMGIEKHCVVKTLRAQFTHDDEYVRRFMDEARVVVQLSHRNICPVFDVGRVGDSYYLAMELVIGRDVRSLLLALDQQRLSADCALHISCEMLDALDYAHRHVDTTTGEPLLLVHRDVSPQNVMINVEGEVKLIDFGLAERAVVLDTPPPSTGTHGRPVTSTNTGATTVMGKMSYMAPEQARGEHVDARADQFAAAIIVYELLTGERFYAGLTSHQIWQQAGTGDFRPPGFAKLDTDLRTLLDRALSPQRDRRFPTCGELRERLLEYGRARSLHAGAKELRALSTKLFASDLQETRDLLRQFAKVAAGNGTSPPPAIDGQVVSIASAKRHADDIRDPTEIHHRSPGSGSGPRQRWSGRLPVAGIARRVPRAAWLGVFALSAAILVAAIVFSPAPAMPAHVSVETTAAASSSAPPLTTQPASAPADTAVHVADPRAAANDAAVEPVVDTGTAAKPKATKRAAAKKPDGAPTTRKAKGSVPITQKFTELRSCKHPCASRWLPLDGKLATIPSADLKRTYDGITACYELCKRQ